MHAIYHYMYIEVLCLNYGTVVVKLYFLPPPPPPPPPKQICLLHNLTRLSMKTSFCLKSSVT